jgi:hypothetical protein
MPEQESGIEQFAHMEEFNNFYDSIHLDGVELKSKGGFFLSTNINQYTTEELQHIQAKADKEMDKAKDEHFIPPWYLRIREELNARSKKK